MRSDLMLKYIIYISASKLMDRSILRSVNRGGAGGRC